MVQAVLDGRKTLSRRIIKPQPSYETQYPLGYITGSTEKKDMGCYGWGMDEYGGRISYAKPQFYTGDILYVRESYCPNYFDDYSPAYRADYRKEKISSEVPEPKWKPSIHMPKAVARIWLQVTDVRVERLTDISDVDVIAEGCKSFKDGRCYEFADTDYDKTGLAHSTPTVAFACFWDSLYAKRGYGWNVNPWVWVYEFEKCEKPIS